MFWYLVKTGPRYLALLQKIPTSLALLSEPQLALQGEFCQMWTSFLSHCICQIFLMPPPLNMASKIQSKMSVGQFGHTHTSLTHPIHTHPASQMWSNSAGLHVFLGSTLDLTTIHSFGVGCDDYCHMVAYRHAAGQAISLPPFAYFPFDLFTLFICMTCVAYATLTMYIGCSLQGGERSLQFFCPLTHCARYATCIDTPWFFCLLTHCASSTGHEPCTLKYSHNIIEQNHSTLFSTMSDESSCSSYAHVLILTKDNFMKWEIQVEA